MLKFSRLINIKLIKQNFQVPHLKSEENREIGENPIRAQRCNGAQLE